MGYALAQAAFEAGAAVELISGPTALPPPYGCAFHPVQTARQMYDAVLAHIARQDIFISVAAVADWRVSHVSQQKLKKGEGNPFSRLHVEPNPDILATVAALPHPPYCVGFAAESDNLIEHSTIKRLEKNIPLLVGNLAQQTLGRDQNEIILFDAAGHTPLPATDKTSLARQLITEIAHRSARLIPSP
jgi:phosphopantothenoylcysteine decarboxylase/phosphopantothenate--cysteine ligase